MINFSYKPMESYYDFHTSTAFERLIAGGFGSGKTYAICAEAIALGLEQPGSRILLTRKTMPELRDTLEPVFLEILPPQLFDAADIRRIGGHYERITLPNGTQFLFRSIDDWHKHKSLNLAAIFWDELSEFDEETYLGMLGRLRQREPTAEGQRYGAGPIQRRFSAAATNPDGHSWIWRRFVNADSRSAATAYWKATSLDNPYLPEEYVNSLLNYPEAWVKRYVLCEWEDFAGQIFENWGEKHMLTDFEIPASPVIWMGMDPGMRDPTAGLWVVVDRENRRLVAVAEYQQTGDAADVHARNWGEIESRLPTKPKWRVADPIVQARERGTGNNLLQIYARLGFNFSIGAAHHRTRIPALQQLVHQNKFVVTPDCPITFEQMREYKWEDISPTARTRGQDPPEKPVKGNDHLVDCAQYLAGRWVQPLSPAKPKGEQLTSWEEFSRDAHRTAKRQIIRGKMGFGNDLGVGV